MLNANFRFSFIKTDPLVVPDVLIDLNTHNHWWLARMHINICILFWVILWLIQLPH